ncbi:MAG: phosphatidate cytidylyltransferase [Planctomycetaceae bacterium]|nr:phosphatidate cytidylyltransferase [Planctomycetaceae bacterium]
MLGWRVLVSVIVVPSLIALFWFDSTLGSAAWGLLAFCLAAAVRNAFEMSTLMRVRSIRPSFRLTGTCSAVVILAAWMHVLLPGHEPSVLISMGWITAALISSFLVLLVREAVVFSEPGASMESLGANLLTVVYGSGLLAIVAQFRWFPDASIAYFAIGSMVIAVKAGDIGAYTFGRLWGKRRMAPKLSPGKTWMGFNGALFGSIAGGGLWLCFGGQLFESAPTPGHPVVVVAYCALMGVVGLLGDLCESLIKRDTGKKDSAALMPGFGGLLDLIDSPIFAGPIALAWWHWLPPAVLP